MADETNDEGAIQMARLTNGRSTVNVDAALAEKLKGSGWKPVARKGRATPTE